MKVIVGCEYSGRVRTEFEKLGHDAISVDINYNSLIPGAHVKYDVLKIIPKEHWDIGIFFPDCTYMCNSGVRWYHTEPGRKELTQKASEFFYQLWNSPIPRICIENPIPHKYAKLPKYTQIVQPWMFGDGYTKATCLWLKNLIPLKPTNIVSGRIQQVHLMSPGKDRGHKRALTYPGLAHAMAIHWG